MIKILTQKDTMILEVDKIVLEEVIVNEDRIKWVLYGTDKEGNKVVLAEYKRPYVSIVMLHIIYKFNSNPHQIIRLPEDDEDVRKLVY